MQRSALIDITKVVASQIIVLHHLAIYSPMAEWLTRAWPRLMAALDAHGRLAVQPFLVIGGFLAAQSLLQRSPALLAGPRWLPLCLAVWQRYRRLLPPLAMALVLVMLATGLVGHHLAHLDWLSPLPGPGVLLAHLLLLQDVLGIASLSAGAWYVAIDLQLFALLLLLARLAAREGSGPRLAGLAAAVTLLTVLSLLLFSRQPDLDEWAIYFFSAYGLGVLAALVARHPPAWPWLATVLVLGLLDQWREPRIRPLLAGLTALALLALAGRPWPQPGEHPGPHPWRRLAGLLRYLSDISYSVFVCHFAVIVLVSGLWAWRGGAGQAWAVAAAALVWALSLAVGALVHAVVEQRWRPLR